MPRPGLFALVLALAACGGPPRRPDAGPPPPPPGPAEIRYLLQLDGAAFAAGATIDVTVSERPAGCGKYRMPMGGSSPSMTPCAPPPPPRSQAFQLTPPEPGAPVLVTTALIAVGAEVNITVAGPAADGCNQVFGQINTFVTDPTEVTVPLSTTELACPR